MKTSITHTHKSMTARAFGIMFILIAALSSLEAQTQMKYWYFNGEGVDFSSATPSTFTTNASISNPISASNGIYLNSEYPLIHVIDKHVYDANGGLIGNLTAEFGMDAELLVVPVPGSCTKFYVIYVEVQGWASEPQPPYFKRGTLRYTEIDMSLNGGMGGFTQGKTNVQVASINYTVVGSIALGKEQTDGTRNLYFAGGDRFDGKVIKCEVDENGVGNPTVLYSNNNLGLATSEVELSNDESMLAFGLLEGPGNEDVVMLHLDANGDLNTNKGNNGITTFDLPGGSGKTYTGIEFTPDNDRFLVGSANDGIYDVTISNGNTSYINGTAGLGDSQIELARNGLMYAAESTSKLIAIDWSQIPPTLPDGSDDISFSGNPIIENQHSAYLGGLDAPEVYTIPDQVDGTNYDDFDITPVDVSSYTATASGTWIANSNPLNGGSSNTAYITEEIRIPSGKVVTIDDMELYFAPGARVIVESGNGEDEPGGKLILDGSLLSVDNRCEAESEEEDQLWNGIEVWGDGNENQFPSNHPYYQGMLVLKNNTVIEHAHTAVLMYKPPIWAMQSGGVIKSYSATFKNNTRSVAFVQYENISPVTGNVLDNESFFTNTTFEVDDNYMGQDDFSAHVTMWAVNGISFSNCTFANYQSEKTVNLTHNRGIYSIDAGYEVTATCDVVLPYGTPCPEEDLNRSTFTGLNFGVHALGAGTDNTINVDQSEFVHNLIGIQVERLDNFSVTRNNFEMGGYQNNYMHEGVISVESKDYRIEDNHFEQTEGESALSVGVRALNNGPYNNEIYNNESNNVTVGEWGQGLNRQDVEECWKGLLILCNDHNNGGDWHYDILVTADNDPNIDGIRDMQTVGPYFMTSAGNIFSRDPINPASDYNNLTNQFLRYDHYGGQSEPLYYSSNVHPVLAVNENTCQSNFDRGLRFQLSSERIGFLENKNDTARWAYEDVQTRYYNLLDDGDSDGLIDKIKTGWFQDSWALRDTLLEIAPYVSQKVIKEAVLVDSITNGMILDICLANPDATTGYDFVDFLQNNDVNPLPDDMTDSIEGSWGTVTARTNIEDSLGHYSHKMDFTSKLLITNAKLDSIRDVQYLRGWYMEKGNLYDKYALAESYISGGQYDSAKIVLDSIDPVLLNNNYLQDEHYGYKSYVAFRHDIDTSDSTIAQLDSLEIDQLQTMADTSTGRASVMAYNILCYFYDQCHDYSSELPDTGQSNKKGNRYKSEINTSNENVIVYPNPADAYVAFDWDFSDQSSKRFLIIRNLSGKIVARKPINGKQGHWTWDTRQLSNGMYLYEIHGESTKPVSGKIILSK